MSQETKPATSPEAKPPSWGQALLMFLGGLALLLPGCGLFVYGLMGSDGAAILGALGAAVFLGSCIATLWGFGLLVGLTLRAIRGRREGNDA